VGHAKPPGPAPTAPLDTPSQPAAWASAFGDSNVLVTGGLGFIGSNLAHRLVGLGAHVTLVDSLIPEYGGNLYNVEGIAKRVRVNIADVRDEHSMAWLVQGQDYLFNLAGQTSHLDSMVDPYTDLDINCRAQLSILEACRKHNPRIKMVYASTRQIYGVPQRLPVDEAHPLSPVDVNGINKLAGEHYHLLYNNVHGIRSAVLRLTNTYGPRMRVKDARQTFLGVWMRRVVEGAPFEIFGDGTQIRDFTYIEDALDAFLQAGASDVANGQVFNVGADEHVTLHGLARLLTGLAACGGFRFVPFPEDRKAVDIGSYYACDAKLRRDLGWAPRVSLDSGLASTLDYYRTHGAGNYWDRDS